MTEWPRTAGSALFDQRRACHQESSLRPLKFEPRIRIWHRHQRFAPPAAHCAMPPEPASTPRRKPLLTAATTTPKNAPNLDSNLLKIKRQNAGDLIANNCKRGPTRQLDRIDESQAKRGRKILDRLDCPACAPGGLHHLHVGIGGAQSRCGKTDPCLPCRRSRPTPATASTPTPARGIECTEANPAAGPGDQPFVCSAD